MTLKSVKFLPVRPSLPRCPSCKAYIGINPVGEWSRCSVCGTSFHDLDHRYKFAASVHYQNEQFIKNLLAAPLTQTSTTSILAPNGKLLRRKVKVISDSGQLSFFGGE